MLVKIGNVDFSRNVLTGTYEVNAYDVYQKWTDANQVEHRDVVRQRVSGSFDLKFLTEEDYASFIETVKANKASDGTLPVSLYVVNENEQRETKVYFKMGPAVRKSLNKKSYTAFTFEVSEP